MTAMDNLLAEKALLDQGSGNPNQENFDHWMAVVVVCMALVISFMTIAISG